MFRQLKNYCQFKISNPQKIDIRQLTPEERKQKIREIEALITTIKENQYQRWILDKLRFVIEVPGSEDTKSKLYILLGQLNYLNGNLEEALNNFNQALELGNQSAQQPRNILLLELAKNHA